MIGCLAIVLTCTGCFYKNWIGKRPCDQPGTKWVSEDNRIQFSVDENQLAVGIMKIDKNEIEILFTNGPSIEVDIYSRAAIGRLDYYPEEHYEYWIGDFKNKDQFTATVKKTTYFEIGQKITFYRVDDGEGVS